MLENNTQSHVLNDWNNKVVDKMQAGSHMLYLVECNKRIYRNGSIPFSNLNGCKYLGQI